MRVVVYLLQENRGNQSILVCAVRRLLSSVSPNLNAY